MVKILVVDDERDITRSIKIGLERKGFVVDTYNDPTDALSNYKPSSYNILIIDIRMPKMNGFELVREIKKRDPKVPVCFLTAFDVYYDEFRRVFPDLDVKYFIKKPIRIDDLAQLINSTLSAP